MPKKTREQKILAAKHRILEPLPILEGSAPTLSVDQFLKPSVPGQASVVTSQRSKVSDDFSYVKLEVYRIIIITALLLGTEGLLFYLIQFRKLFF